MSTAVFPTLKGLEFPVSRSPVWDTIKQLAVSGKETRLALQTSPRWQWQVSFSVLRTAAALQEFQTLVGFYNARQGGFDTFLYTDPDDGSVTTQAIGIGDGAAVAFQLVRSLGGFVEPVLAPHAVSAVYLAGVSIPTAGYSPPAAPVLGSSASGALGATTYYVKCSWVTNSGETLPGSEASLAVAANRVLTVTRPSSPPAGAVSWNVYASNTAGGGSGAETLQATIAVATTSWSEPTSGLVSGVNPLASNTTGWSFSTWGTLVPGVLTFGGPVVNSIAVTADFTYYWPCRFDQDNCAFTLFVSGMYSVKKLAWMSVKN